MVERKLDASDDTLRNSVVFKVVQALRHAARRKLVRMVEKRKGMCVWATGDAVTLRVTHCCHEQVAYDRRNEDGRQDLSPFGAAGLSSVAAGAAVEKAPRSKFAIAVLLLGWRTLSWHSRDVSVPKTLPSIPSKGSHHQTVVSNT